MLPPEKVRGQSLSLELLAVEFQFHIKKSHRTATETYNLFR